MVRDCFRANALSCHGDTGEGGVGDKLAAGQGNELSNWQNLCSPSAAFVPYAPPYSTISGRAMPQNAPQSLSNDECLRVSAYLLNLNGFAARPTPTLDANPLRRQDAAARTNRRP